MDAFTADVLHISHIRALLRADLLRRLPPILLLAVFGAPCALASSLVVATVASADAAVTFTVRLPAVDARETWDEEVEAFSLRLEEGFGLDANRADLFAAWILEASIRQKLPPELVASLVYTESTFRTDARSRSGAIGPAQVKPHFWTHFCGGVDLTDPEQNVYCGAQIIAHYAARCGDVDCAFRIYNVGPRNLRDPYYRARSHLYLAKIEDGRSRLSGAQAPAAAAL
jgi:soluble lytic murein transglycosylase-like protein